MFKLTIGIAFGLLLFSNAAMAACSVPITLTNGTTADATQVMTNFTSLAGCAAPLASPAFTGSVSTSGAFYTGGGGTTITLNTSRISADSDILFEENAGGLYDARIGAVTQAANNAGFAIAMGGAALTSPAFYIKQNGYIGIGTPSPISLLDVEGGSGSANVLFKATSGQTSLNLDGPTGSLSELYNSINGTAIWASGITGYGGTNAYAWFSYPLGGPAFYINTTGNAAVSGCLTYNGGTLGTCLSDVRTKKNITPFRAGLQQIAALNPVTYEYNGLGEAEADGKVRTGLIAQDVQMVAPGLVQFSNTKLKQAQRDSKPLLAVKYGDLTFALINAVKELKAANDNQADEIAHLEAQMSVLQRKLVDRI